MKMYRNRNLPACLLKKRDDLYSGKEIGDSTNEMVKDNLHCLCRGPDDGRFMIQCDECREWFHGECVHVTEIQAGLIDVYLCPGCNCC